MTVSVVNIRKVKLPRRFLAYEENVGPYKENPALFEKLFTKVMSWAGPKGLLNNPKLESIAIYHDDPDQVPEEKQRISVGFTVPEDTVTEGDIKMMEIPEGEFVVGSFELLPNEYGQAWMQMMEFMNDEQLIPAGIMYESYKNDPDQHPEGKHVVDICVGV